MNNEINNINELTNYIDKKIQKLEEQDKRILKIEVSNRHYNGDFGVGSIFDEKYDFEIDGNLCISNSKKTFCSNEKVGGNVLSSVNISFPIILKESNKQQINNIVKTIKSNADFIYNEYHHYKKDSFDFNRYNYIDVKIDGKSYEISVINDEKLLNELKKLLGINKIDMMFKSIIDDIISAGGGYDE